MTGRPAPIRSIVDHREVNSRGWAGDSASVHRFLPSCFKASGTAAARDQKLPHSWPGGGHGQVDLVWAMRRTSAGVAWRRRLLRVSGGVTHVRGLGGDDPVGFPVVPRAASINPARSCLLGPPAGRSVEVFSYSSGYAQSCSRLSSHASNHQQNCLFHKARPRRVAVCIPRDPVLALVEAVTMAGGSAEGRGKDPGQTRRRPGPKKRWVLPHGSQPGSAQQLDWRGRQRAGPPVARRPGAAPPAASAGCRALRRRPDRPPGSRPYAGSRVARDPCRSG